MIVESLKKLIDQKYAITINSNNSENSSVIIDETDPEAKLKKVEITDFSAAMTYAFKLDLDQKGICNYFDRYASNVHKACDGIIFTQINKQDYIFFCELKSSRPNEEECLLKYQNSKLFADYLINILKSFYHIDKEINPIYKYILFDTKKKEPKSPTKKHKIQTSILKFSEFQLPVYRIHCQIDSLNNTVANIKINIRHLEL